jgi:hypothetical protein
LTPRIASVAGADCGGTAPDCHAGDLVDAIHEPGLSLWRVSSAAWLD